MSSSPTPDWTDALQRARAHSPFLARALDRQPDLAALIESGTDAAAFEWAAAQAGHDDPAAGLRRERLALATVLAIGDLAGAYSLAEVVGRLSDFADHALDRAIRTAIAERIGEERVDGMIALALGKQGARELNYSSDIDPILLYDPTLLPCRAGDDPGEAAQRYARRIVKLLADNTADGYVLRVDLRLRPASEISPLAVPRGSALAHYQGQALAWERAAFVRARAAAGDVNAGEDFLAEINPFVWRSVLDFGAVEEIRTLTQRIRDSHDGPAIAGPGFDVKRGRGGIREIEFFAQTHQLIHGGRDPSLRVRGTRAALDALAAAGRIAPDHARILGEGYDRLRVIEHRLQMVHDRQTHSLPTGNALDNVARLDGLPDAEALVDELRDLTERTGSIYDELIEPSPSSGGVVHKPSELERYVCSLGYDEPEALTARIEGWRSGHFAALRSPQAREAFDRLLPPLLETIAQSDDPARALTRWETILERAPSLVTLFRLLVAQPDLLGRLVAALTLAPTLADQLGRRPELLDALIDPKPVAIETGAEARKAMMREACARDDYEARLDAIRRVTSEARFALGLRLIEGGHRPIAIGQALATTAEAAICVAVEATLAEFTQAHGRIADSELVILGLGRLGGGVLTHASDLDIVYLFTGDFAAQSDGPRPLGATLYYNRLASRVSAALSVPTAQGALYEVDTRLRPQGNQGPLAASVDSFAKYQRESAWIWEHMALTRARVLVGSDAAQESVDRLVASVLRSARDEDDLRKGVLKMRRDMAQHKSPKGPLDVKLQRGGLVDIEFITHFTQLRIGSKLKHGDEDALSPDLGAAIGALVAAGHVPQSLAAAYELLTDILIAGRLLAPDGNEPPPAAAKALARACQRDSYAELTGDLSVARKNVAQYWADIFDETLETDDE